MFSMKIYIVFNMERGNRSMKFLSLKRYLKYGRALFQLIMVQEYSDGTFGGLAYLNITLVTTSFIHSLGNKCCKQVLYITIKRKVCTL